MTERIIQTPDGPIRVSEPTIPPEMLRGKFLSDNESQETQGLLENWERARTQRNQTTIIACGDARLILPHRTTLNLRSIAAAGITKQSAITKSYLPIINNPYSKNILVMGHFDGRTLMSGERIKGCGGLGAKEAEKQTKEPRSGVSRYVWTHIQDKDVYLQTIKAALAISKGREEPVMPALQDHITGAIYPIGVFSNYAQVVDAAVDVDELFQDNFDPKEIYENGIPVIDDNVMPDELQELLIQQSIDVKLLKEKYPDFEKRQEVQNPKMIVATTENRSMKIRYPQTAREPGSIFKLHIARTPSGEVLMDTVKDIADQLNYPITHATKNYNKKGQPFSKTDTLLIETEDIYYSYAIALYLFNQRWMQMWAQLPNRSAMVAQTQGGKTSEMEILKAA